MLLLKTLNFFLGIMFFWAGASFAAYQITIQPLITVNSEYVDNLFQSSESKEDDLVSLVSPGILAELKNRSNKISFSYNLGYSRYSRFPEYNSWRQNAILKGQLQLSRYTKILFENSGNITEEPGKRPESSDTSDEYRAEKERVRQSRERYLTNTSQISLSHQWSRTGTFTMSYAYDILRNEDPGIRNEDHHRPSVTVTWWPVPRRLQTTSSLRYTRDDVKASTENSAYLDEELTPSIQLTYWVIPRVFSLKTGLVYILGVSNDDEDLADPLNDNDNWYESLTPSLGFSYYYRPYHLTFDASTYYKNIITYDNNDLSDLSDDIETWYGNFRVTKQINKRLDIFFQYAHTSTQYAGGKENQDYSVHEPTFGIRYILAKGLPLSLSVGYLVRNKAEGKESAYTLNGELGTWRFSKRGSLTFNASSGYDEDNFGTEKLGFGLHYDAQLRLNYVFSKELSADIYGLYQRNHYVDNEGLEDGDTRDDRTIEVGMGLTYKPVQWFFMRLNYSHRNVDATNPEDSYKSNRISVQANMSPVQPFRLE